MSLLNRYTEFRRNPKVASLTNNAIMAYVSSGVEFLGPDQIVSHLIKDEREVNKTENIISKHETANSLVLEIDTIIEFVRGPGALLPGISNNLVADEKVSLVMVHIIAFDEAGQICGAKYIWDQATILKQLNIIGSRGNAWPICRGEHQVKTVIRVQEIVESNKGSDMGDQKPSLLQQSNRDITPPASHTSPMRSAPTPVNLFENAPLIEDIPIPTRAIEPPSPSAKPVQRSINQILGVPGNSDFSGRSSRSNGRSTHGASGPKSSYINLFGEDEDTNSGYTRVIGGGGGGYSDSKKGLKPSWHWGDDDKENSVSR